MSQVGLSELSHAVVGGDAERARVLTRCALAEGVPPENILTSELMPAMDEVGSRFGAGTFFLPDLLLATRAMKDALALLTPNSPLEGSHP